MTFSSLPAALEDEMDVPITAALVTPAPEASAGATISIVRTLFAHQRGVARWLGFCKLLRNMVGAQGLEPRTSCV